MLIKNLYEGLKNVKTLAEMDNYLRANYNITGFKEKDLDYSTEIDSYYCQIDNKTWVEIRFILLEHVKNVGYIDFYLKLIDVKEINKGSIK